MSSSRSVAGHFPLRQPAREPRSAVRAARTPSPLRNGDRTGRAGCPEQSLAHRENRQWLLCGLDAFALRNGIDNGRPTMNKKADVTALDLSLVDRIPQFPESGLLAWLGTWQS